MTDLLPDIIGDEIDTDPVRRANWLRSPKTIVGLSILGVFALLAIFGPLIAPDDPTASSSAILAHPSASHLLGTTSEGQDVLSELLVGARDSRSNISAKRTRPPFVPSMPRSST